MSDDSKIKLRPVEGSSAIIGEYYDAQNKTLYLRFTNGHEPHPIEDVSPETYRLFMMSKSKGRFYHSFLR